MLTIDQLTPEDHLVRKIESAIDFSFIYHLVENLYSGLGRPSIDPVVLFKMTFIQYIFGIRSMRQTIKEIETNMAYRWFLGFGLILEFVRTVHLSRSVQEVRIIKS
jgi:transposase